MGTQQRCLDLINTEARSIEWTHKGRFSIQDTSSEGYFRVLIRKLTVEDNGTYRCAVADFDQSDTIVKLNVIEGEESLIYRFTEKPSCILASISTSMKNSTLLINLYN